MRIEEKIVAAIQNEKKPKNKHRWQNAQVRERIMRSAARLKGTK